MLAARLLVTLRWIDYPKHWGLFYYCFAIIDYKNAVARNIINRALLIVVFHVAAAFFLFRRGIP